MKALLRLHCAACGMLAKDFSHQCAEEPVRRIQDSPDFSWKAWRAGGIGSSDAPFVMDASPYGSPLKLWELKTGRRLPDSPTKPMLQGIRAEPHIRDWYERQIGMKMPKDLEIHPRYDFIRASFDGRNLEEDKIVEFKFAGQKDHAIAAAGEVPRKYRYQLIQQMAVSGCETIDYVSYFSPDRENPEIGHGVIVPFHRDPKLEKKLIAANVAFWECVLDDTPPVAPKKVIDSIFKLKRSKG